MIKFLTALLSLLSRLWAEWHDHKLREQGRQDERKEGADEVQRQVDLAERAAAVDDPTRAERLRARFDAAASE